MSALETMLEGFHDGDVIEWLRFGWPINADHEKSPAQLRYNHAGATNVAALVDLYIQKEQQHGALLGPFQRTLFHREWALSPRNTRPRP